MRSDGPLTGVLVSPVQIPRPRDAAEIPPSAVDQSAAELHVRLRRFRRMAGFGRALRQGVALDGREQRPHYERFYRLYGDVVVRLLLRK